MTQVSIALIGCGAASQRYYIQALKKATNDIASLYLVDRIADLAENVKAQIGYGQIATSIDDVINNIDGAIIVLPNHLHYEVASRLIESGKHVLCEKPLTEDANEAEELVRLAEENGVELCVNNTRRMYPSFQKIKDLLKSGEIGKLRTLNYKEGNEYGWNSETGFSVNPAITTRGVLNDIGPHVIDTICWWIGERPSLKEYRDDSFGGPESIAKAIFEHNDCKIEVFLNRLNELDSGFVIEGDKGKIVGAQYDWNKVCVESLQGQKRYIKLKCRERTYPEFIIPIVKNFIRVIQGEEKALISGGDVADSIKLIDQCYHNRQRFEMPWNNHQITIEGDHVKTLVTGATGSIGGRVVEMLHFSGDRIPIGTIRQWGTAARIGRLPIDIRKLDLLDKKSIDAALEDVSEIIHCAKGNPEVTVQGTKNLLEAAARHNIKRIVYMSTAEVYGDVSGEVDESFPLKYTGDEYNQMKIDAEKICWEFIEKNAPIVILRPSIVYGPFSKNWSTRFAKLFLSGKWGIYENAGQGKCNLIYVDDLVRAITLSLKNIDACGKAFNIVDPEISTWNDYFIRFNQELGMPPLRRVKQGRKISKSVVIEPIRYVGSIVQNHFMGIVKMIADRSEAIKNLLKYTIAEVKSTPSPSEFKLFNKDFTLSSSRAESILNFKAKVAMKEGILQSVNWIKHNGIK